MTLSDSAIYIKINRDEDYSIHCIEYWISVAKCTQYPLYIVSDNESLNAKINSRVHEDSKLIYINSTDEDNVMQICKSIASPKWQKAANAHMTTFYHAQKNAIKAFWNIDADDTIFLLKPEKLSNALRIVESYAQNNDIDIMSLDMWWSLYKGKFWSLGVSYVRNENINWMETLLFHRTDEKYCLKREKLLKSSILIPADCIDWYFDYLMREQICELRTFYIYNTDFIHWETGHGPLHYRFREGVNRFSIRPSCLFSNIMPAGPIRINSHSIPIDAHLSVLDRTLSRKDLKRISSGYDLNPLLYHFKKSGFSGVINTMRTTIHERANKVYSG